MEEIDMDSHYYYLFRPEVKVVEGKFGQLFVWPIDQRERWVECVVKPNPISPNYKVDLLPIEEGYKKETFYDVDFLSHLEGGFIVKKDMEYECVEETWKEPLNSNGTVYVVHSAYKLQLKSKQKEVNN